MSNIKATVTSPSDIPSGQDHRLTPVLLWVPAEPVADPATGVLHNKLGLSAAEEPNW